MNSFANLVERLDKKRFLFLPQHLSDRLERHAPRSKKHTFIHNLILFSDYVQFYNGDSGEYHNLEVKTWERSLYLRSMNVTTHPHYFSLYEYGKAKFYLVGMKQIRASGRVNEHGFPIFERINDEVVSLENVRFDEIVDAHKNILADLFHRFGYRLATEVTTTEVLRLRNLDIEKQNEEWKRNNEEAKERRDAEARARAMDLTASAESDIVSMAPLNFISQ